MAVPLWTVSNQRPGAVGPLWLHRVKTLACISLLGVQGSAADAVRQWVDLWAGGEPGEVRWVTPPWLKVTSKPTSEPLTHHITTPYPPRDNCVLLRYRALKWSWQGSIYKVIWARRMESAALAVFEFCPTEVLFSLPVFASVPPPHTHTQTTFPSQPAFMQLDKKYTACTWNYEIWPAHGRQSR